MRSRTARTTGNRPPDVARHRAGRRAAGVERGETLVEILVTVAIMGLAFVGIFAGLTGSFTMSAAHRDSADGTNLLVSAADAVKAASYVPCPTLSTSSYNPTQGVSLPAGWSATNVAVTAVKGWNGSSLVRV